MSKESELLKKEIIEHYHCDSLYRDRCDGDCDICRKWLSDDLDDFEKEVRADAIDDAIHHLDNSRVNCHEDYVDGIDFAIGVLEQLKEQNIK